MYYVAHAGWGMGPLELDACRRAPSGVDWAQGVLWAGAGGKLAGVIHAQVDS